MKIKPQHVLALALMGTQGAWAADGANASLDFLIRAWPLYPGLFIRTAKTFFARSIPTVTIAMISPLGQVDEKFALPIVALSCR